MNEGDKNTFGSPLAKYKLVFLGDQSTGKTSIINRFIYDTFDGKDHPTVGVDFISKTLNFENRTIRLQLWDTAGQERFRSLIPSYIRDSSVAVVVFDVSSKSSFSNLTKWVNDVRGERGSEVLLVIVGNKIDIEEREVTKAEGEQLAKEHDAIYYEVSAKLGTNINNLFMSIASTLPGAEISQMVSPNQNPLNDNNNAGNKGGVVLNTADANKEKPAKSGCC